MKLVVDASVAAKWLVQERDSDIANSLRLSGHDLHAPWFLSMELGNTLWQKSRRGQITRVEAMMLLERIAELPVEWTDTDVLTPAAIRLALELDHPVYDCIYLALARQKEAFVVTADTRFVKALEGTHYEGLVRTMAQLAAL